MGKYEVKFDKGNLVIIKTYDTWVDAITAAAEGNGKIIERR